MILPFVEPGGYFIAYKSGEIDEELEALKKQSVYLVVKLSMFINLVCPVQILDVHLYL